MHFWLLRYPSVHLSLPSIIEESLADKYILSNSDILSYKTLFMIMVVVVVMNPIFIFFIYIKWRSVVSKYLLDTQVPCRHVCQADKDPMR